MSFLSFICCRQEEPKGKDEDKDKEQESEEESAAMVSDESDSDIPIAEMNIPEGPAAPTFSLGALATTESAPKKKAASKKAAAKKAEEEDEVFDAGDDADESAVHTAIKDDMLLKQVARALDSAPPCLLGLLPDVVFEKKVGHQIRGVPRLALAS